MLSVIAGMTERGFRYENGHWVAHDKCSFQVENIGLLHTVTVQFLAVEL